MQKLTHGRILREKVTATGVQIRMRQPTLPLEGAHGAHLACADAEEKVTRENSNTVVNQQNQNNQHIYHHTIQIQFSTTYHPLATFYK